METTGVIPNSIVTDPFIACHFGERRESLGENVFNSERTLTDMSVGATVESTPQDLSTALVAVGQGQDRQSFHCLFEHFAPRLKSFMLKRGVESSGAEEVVQETMVNVWRKAHLFKPDRASASTWIFTIARNVQIDLYRKAKRPELDPDDPALVPEATPLAYETIEKDQEAGQLNDVIACLPLEQREVLQMAFFQELSHPQIAENLGIPLGTVKSRIRLAFKRIRSELGDL